MLNYFLNFLFVEIYLLKGFSFFWLIVSIIFFWRYLIKELTRREFKFKEGIFISWPIILFYIVFLVLPWILNWTRNFSQIFFIFGFIVFYFLIRFYIRFFKNVDFFRLFAPCVFGIITYLFFRSNLFKNFFWKETLVIISLFLFFETYRSIFNFNKKISPLFSLAPTFILSEFLWILNFLPINFLSLAGIWLILFVLINEFWLLNSQKLFTLKYFLPELILSLILIFIILLTTNWQML